MNLAHTRPRFKQPQDKFEAHGLLGVIYSPTDRIDIDLGIRKSVNRAKFDRACLIGAAFRW